MFIVKCIKWDTPTQSVPCSELHLQSIIEVKLHPLKLGDSQCNAPPTPLI